jgi:hypothetical protein
MTDNNNNDTPIQKFITARQAALRLGLTYRSLEQQRNEGRGPRYFKFGNEVRYDPADIERYLKAKEDRTPISLDEVASVLGVSVEAVYSLSTESGLRIRRNGWRAFVYRGELMLFLETLRRVPAPSGPSPPDKRASRTGQGKVHRRAVVRLVERSVPSVRLPASRDVRPTRPITHALAMVTRQPRR